MHKRLTSIFTVTTILAILCIDCSTTSHSARNKDQQAIRPSSKRGRKKPGSTSQQKYKKHKLQGVASYYGRKFHRKKTASGERFNMYDLTAAHRTLPFNTRIKVTNLENNKSVIVRINDRGPFTKGRVVDLSFKAAKEIGLIQKGTAKVRIKVLSK